MAEVNKWLKFADFVKLSCILYIGRTCLIFSYKRSFCLWKMKEWKKKRELFSLGQTETLRIKSIKYTKLPLGRIQIDRIVSKMTEFWGINSLEPLKDFGNMKRDGTLRNHSTGSKIRVHLPDCFYYYDHLDRDVILIMKQYL